VTSREVDNAGDFAFAAGQSHAQVVGGDSGRSESGAADSSYIGARHNVARPCAVVRAARSHPALPMSAEHAGECIRRTPPHEVTARPPRTMDGEASRCEPRTRRNTSPLISAVRTGCATDATQEIFSDGMTEELITQLGSLDPNHLGVIERTSAMQYKGARKDVMQIARELGVNYVLEGSIRGTKERIRVTAQLISSGDQTHIWAQSFDRDSSDVLRLQSEVARAIAEKIQLTLPQKSASRLSGSPSLNPQAHEAFLEGLDAANQRTKADFERAIAAFNRAIVLDPEYALAYAELARTYSLATVFALGTPTDMMINARNAATRALQIDDSVAAAHTTLGFIYAHLDFDWLAAEREFRRGIELNPSVANAHLFYSNSLLSPMGRHEDAIAEMQIAVRLDPLSAPVDSFLGRTNLWARRYSDSQAHLQKSVQRFPNFALNHVRLAHLYTYMNKFDDAIAEEVKAWALSGIDAAEAHNRADALRLALASKGPPGYWERVLELSRTAINAPEAYSSSYGMAILFTRLGQNDQAIDSLELAFTQRQLAMTELAIEPAFDPLQSDARFVRLLRRVGLK
jgi:TolB-like protein